MRREKKARRSRPHPRSLTRPLSLLFRRLPTRPRATAAQRGPSPSRPAPTPAPAPAAKPPTHSAAATPAELAAARAAAAASLASAPPPEWADRFGGRPRKGADILVQALEREGVTTTFGYPGGASLEIHQALTRSDTIRNILCRHEQVREAFLQTREARREGGGRR